jgi:aryl-alcohol dehydrogenase-like predicted oxidoreductase
VAATSLAWLAAQPTVVSPIASARTPAQLAELMAMTDLELSVDELRALDDASA